MAKSYISIGEVAKRFGVNVTTIYRLAQKGQIPGFKIGNQWRFSERLLEAWVADQVTVKWLMSEEMTALNRRAKPLKVPKGQ